MSLGASHSLFLSLEKKETGVIALDNAAIRLGRNGRAVWKALHRANKELEVLENLHHPAHLCARLPIPNASCAALDQKLEMILRSKVEFIRAQSQVNWKAGSEQASLEASQLKRQVGVHRALSLPIQRVRCGTCGLDHAWEFSPEFRAHLSEDVSASIVGDLWRARVVYLGKSLRRTKDWNYRIEVRDGQ